MGIGCGIGVADLDAEVVCSCADASEDSVGAALFCPSSGEIRSSLFDDGGTCTYKKTFVVKIFFLRT